MKTETDIELDREGHGEERAARKAEALAVKAGLNPCPSCTQEITADEVMKCTHCERAGCRSCLSFHGDEDGPFCDDDCRSRYYWGITAAEIRVRFMQMSLGEGYWQAENPYEERTKDGLRMQADFLHDQEPTIRVQLLSRKAG